MRKRILITGCSGFLASHLIDQLLLNGAGRTYTLSGMTEVLEFESNTFDIYYADIRNRDHIFNAIQGIRPTLTFHLAAISNVGYSWKHQQLTYEVNFVGTSNLLEALSEFSPDSRVLLMSSAELYGGKNTESPCSETTPLAARNPYALSKMAMEMLGDLYLQNSKNRLEIIKLRSFNFTGPGQDRQFMASDFSHQIAEIEKGKREPVIHVGNLSVKRDFSDVRDIARYLNVISEKGENGGIYNLCSGNVFSTEEILDILLSFSTQKIEKVVDEEKFRPVDVPFLMGDNRLIRETFHLLPRYEITETLRDLLGYWRKKVGE
ncbi:MAG: GDP-mannose 4,6-dehydratase [Candidatus Omnitrophota bacterium]